MNRSKLPCGRPRPPRAPAPSAAQLQIWQQQLRDHLTKMGLKYTEQRWSIAQTILESGEHLDPQGMVQKVKERDPSIGAATVYRSIKVLIEAGLLQSSQANRDGQELYEPPATTHHDHLICLDCDAIFEFHNPAIEAQQDAVAQQTHFSVQGHRHVIYGRCQYLIKPSEIA